MVVNIPFLSYFRAYGIKLVVAPAAPNILQVVLSDLVTVCDCNPYVNQSRLGYYAYSSILAIRDKLWLLKYLLFSFEDLSRIQDRWVSVLPTSKLWSPIMRFWLVCLFLLSVTNHFDYLFINPHIHILSCIHKGCKCSRHSKICVY